MAHPLENYLSELQRNRPLGVKETSHYGTLQNLFNEIGRELKPAVRLVLHPAGKQAEGIADGGLFAADQGQHPLAGTLPARGAVEVKGTGEEVRAIARSEQVRKYLLKYRQVLVTNYRSFLLVAAGQDGGPVELEEFRLADDEKGFWAASPSRLAADQGSRFVEYLKRVMLNAAALTSPEQVAWFLASYARDAKDGIERADLPTLAAVRSGLEEALGLKFEGAKGEHFFRSTMIQTLFYGIFSAWVLWHNEDPARTDKFDWRTSAWSLRVPMIRALFHELTSPGKLRSLGLVEVLNWTGAALNRVDRGAFFARFDDGQAVQYFYEPFLQAFDPELRKDLGVWYTPPEIVRYMVARVDRTLREELAIPDGLADPNVYVLDPCTGTGSFLVEVLRRIDRTLAAKGEDALGGSDLKEAAMHRVFGFEILPAPFVVAHLQLGLLLQNRGVPLAEEGNERVGVYLTNALTGWEPPKGPKQQLMFAELQQERDAAEEVKRDKPILVVLGNPPYNAFAGTSPTEEAGLVEPYKAGLNTTWGIKKFNLDDLYVRFFRLAERRIAINDRPGQGVVCYISNASYLSDPSYVVMRQRFLAEFDGLWFDNLNGDSRETGKLTPEGKPDPSVFSTEYNREGIRVGTAIGLMIRRPAHLAATPPVVRYRQFWGVTKRADLLESLKAADFDSQYVSANPDPSNRYSFRPSDVKAHYQEWPKLTELCLAPPFNGPIERRGNSLIVYKAEKNELNLLESYLDVNISDSEVNTKAPRFMKSSGEFQAEKTRNLLKGKTRFDVQKIVPYPFKPFDVRLAYLDTSIQPLFSRPSPELLMMRNIPNNLFFITRDTADRDPEGPPFYFAPMVCDYDCISGHARHFPILVNENKTSKNKRNALGQASLFGGEDEPPTRANLSAQARQYLNGLGLTDPDRDADTAGLIWWHALAIGYAPAYLSENADGIRQDWPRLPLPSSLSALEASARLGQRVAALLDTESGVAGVTVGTLEPIYARIGSLARVGGGPLQPDRGELTVRAGWGHAGKEGVTMPGKGRSESRAYGPEELAAMDEQAARQGLTHQEVLNRLGQATRDIYLNEVAYWKNLPALVWDYTIGGYQVIKKWLSYREHDLLKRSLTPDEAREVRDMARRIAAILLLEPALDANYAAVKLDSYPWPAPVRG